MASLELAEDLARLDATLTSVEKVLNIPKLLAEAGELETQAAAPDLWDDQANAQAVTSRLSFVQGEIRKVAELRQRLDDAKVLRELGEAESDGSIQAEVQGEIDALEKLVGEIEVRTLLNGGL